MNHIRVTQAEAKLLMNRLLMISSVRVLGWARFRGMVLAAIVCRGALVPCALLMAQQGSALSPARSPMASGVVLDSVPRPRRSPQEAANPTDTGDFAHGHHSFERYTVPLFCVVAARTEAKYARRTAALTAAAYMLQRAMPAQDTLPASVTRVARACGARFLAQPVAQMTAADLPALFALALLAQQDIVAQAILARSAALAPTDAARQQVWLDGLDMLLHAEPARVAAARALLAQWTRQGPSAAALQVGGAARFLTFWQQHFDRARMQEGAEALLHLEPDTTEPVSIRIALLNGRLAAYSALWQMAAVEHPDSLAVVGQQVVRDLQRPVWDMPGWQQINLKWVREFQSVRHDAEALRVWATDESQAFRYLRVNGPPMPSFVAAYWITPTGSTARDTVVRPTPGRVSLFIRPKIDCYNHDLYESWGDRTCTPALDRLARWQRLYGGYGLEITVIGYSTDGALYSGPLPLAAQAEAIAWYVHRFAQLPVTVAVQAGGVTRLPVPDGTINWGKATWAFDQQYRDRSNDALAVLTDRAGRVVYVGPDDASLLDALLARLINAPSTVNSLAPPGTAPLGSRAAPATVTSSSAAFSPGTAPVTPSTH
jgi:hypothetical protein